jgi:hypothetical protein
MSANKNPQQSEFDGSASGRQQSEQSAAPRGQQFEGVRDASRGSDAAANETGSQDVERILDQLEENCRSLRQAIGSGRSGENSASRTANASRTGSADLGANSSARTSGA